MESLFASTIQKTTTFEQVFHYLLERSLYYVKLMRDVHISEETLQQVEPLFKDLMQMIFEKEIAFLSDLLAKNTDFKTVEHELLAANLIDLAESSKNRVKKTYPNMPEKINVEMEKIFILC